MAHFNFNKVILGGRLTATPELKQTPGGVMVAQFTVAVNRRAAKDGTVTADFIRVTAWRELAEFVTKYFRKGSSVCVVGAIQTRTWSDRQGNKQYATDVVADEAHFVDSKGESGAPIPQSASPTAPFTQGSLDKEGDNPVGDGSHDVPCLPTFETITGDDDLPF